MDKMFITLPFLIFLLQLQLVPTCSSSLGSDLCDTTSSCGDIRNISYPFRLTTDPIACSDKHLEISCHNNVPMLIYKKSERYYVRSIDYNSLTIRLSDASLVPQPNNKTFLCNNSLAVDPYPVGKLGSILFKYPASYIHYGELHGGIMLEQNIVIMSCASPLAIEGESQKWSRYVDGAICSSSVEHARSSTTSSYWYAAVVDTAWVYPYQLADSCQVELMLQTSKPLDSSKGIVSINDVLEIWSYGFEVSWLSWFCSQSSHRAIPCSYFDNLSLSRLRIYFLVSYGFTLYAMLHGIFLIIGAPMIIAFLVYKWRRRHLSGYENIEEFMQITCDQLMPVRYSYTDIKKITKGFKSKLGQGGYGSVYMGKLRSGQLAAVKMLNKADTDGNDFINEVATIGRVHHFNVVRLIGFCAEGSKRAIVYSFMPNGSLEKYIFPREQSDMNSIPTISDEKMYEIALEVTRGIEYLHRGCEMQILHFDIKPHNILLDEDFVPKVADFGLARLYPTNTTSVSLTAVKGTLGYMAPEFFYRNVGSISYKADVYSFGRMLMEMAVRKKDLVSPAVNSSQIFLPTWVHDQFSQGNDIWPGDNIDEEKEIRKKTMMVGLWCVQLSPADRPSMHKVAEMLQGRLDTLGLPPKPSFAPPFRSMNIEDTSTEITNASWDTSSVYITCESANKAFEAALIEAEEFVV